MCTPHLVKNEGLIRHIVFNNVFSSSRVPQYKSQSQLGVLTTLSEFFFLTPTVHYISSFSGKLERMLVPHFGCRSRFPRRRSQYFSREVVLLSCSLKFTSLLLYMLLERKVGVYSKTTVGILHNDCHNTTCIRARSLTSLLRRSLHGKVTL